MWGEQPNNWWSILKHEWIYDIKTPSMKFIFFYWRISAFTLQSTNDSFQENKNKNKNKNKQQFWQAVSLV